MSFTFVPETRPGRVGWILSALMALAHLTSCTPPAAPGKNRVEKTVDRTVVERRTEILGDETNHSVTVRTPELEAKFKDGRIVHLVNRLTGEVVCDERLDNAALLPGGMGTLSGNIPAMSASHVPWGNQQLNQDLRGDVFSPNQHVPDAQSAFRLEQDGHTATATWTGLANGTDRFPGEAIAIRIDLNPAGGGLAFRATGRSDTGGVFGIQVPLANIVPVSRFFLPSFGGLRYDRSHAPVLMSLGGAPFVETPAAAFETAIGSVGLWNEDERFPDYYLFWGWNGKSFSLAFEHLNRMPFEPHRSIESVTWRLNVFTGGWVDAYTPYRDWYRKTFASEFKARDAVAWANDIRVVIDNYATTPEAMQTVARTFDPSTVLLHNWNGRAPGFDTELPDWTPREGYTEGVKVAHASGLKTMAYVNTYCINYNSPFFIRDNLRNFFLTRKSSIYQYEGPKQPGAVSELLIGTVNRAEAGDPYAGMEDGKILYGDPLSAGWRKYHCAQMREWNKITGTDANYEDTAGCAGDFGNGVVDGLAGAQGSVIMLRDLLDSQPQVPMASEYGPAPIAFGVKWPLNYAQVWGNVEFRQFRLHRQHPISAYLYGNRQWIPMIGAESDFLKHLVTGCSDALGGMAQTFGTPEALAIDREMSGHMTYRAKLFSRLRLTPVFSRERYEKNLVCMYEDKDGKRYRYYDDGAVQRMVGPDGKDLYARVGGVNRLRTGLHLPGWPAIAKGELLGLNPEGSYALFPATDASAPALQVLSLPEGVVVSRYAETADFTMLVLSPAKGGPARAAIELALNRDLPMLSVNGRAMKPEATLSLEVDLPATLLHSRAGNQVGFGEKIGDDATVMLREVGSQGLEYGPSLALAKIVPGAQSGRYFFSYGDKVADFLLAVPNDPKAALRVSLQNLSPKYGNASRARICLDHRPIHERDFGSPDLKLQEHDQRPYEWLVPLGAFAGRTVLVTVASDGKFDSNSDSMWIGIPELVRDEAQVFAERIQLVGRSAQARDLVNDEDPAAWEGMVKVNAEVKRAGAGSFELFGEYTTSLIAKEFIPVAPDKTYVLSSWLRSLAEQPPASANFGLRMYDKDKRPIHINNVSVCPNTATKLAVAAAPGATELLLVRPAGFVAPEFSTVAFHATDDFSDLPNFDLSPEVTTLAEEGDRVRLTLKAPLEKDYPAGTPVRLHSPWGAPCYWIADGWLPTDWKEFTTTFRGEARTGTSIDQFWRGTRYVRPFVWFGNYNRTPKSGARLLADDIRFTEQ